MSKKDSKKNEEKSEGKAGQQRADEELERLNQGLDAADKDAVECIQRRAMRGDGPCVYTAKSGMRVLVTADDLVLDPDAAAAPLKVERVGASDADKAPRCDTWVARRASGGAVPLAEVGSACSECLGERGGGDGVSFVAYVADPSPVPGVYSCLEDALAAAYAMLPADNAVGHVVEIGTTDPASRRRLYCLTADGAWREILR